MMHIGGNWTGKSVSPADPKKIWQPASSLSAQSHIQNRREPGETFFTGMENRYGKTGKTGMFDRLFLKRLDRDMCKCDHRQNRYMTKDVKKKQSTNKHEFPFG